MTQTDDKGPLEPASPNPSFNLVDEGFIPCTHAETGELQMVGLRDVLLNAHSLSEIQSESPLETVAIVRLLLAVLYAAINPQDEVDWETLWQAEKFAPNKINAYLDKWHDRFDLFSLTRPFLQVANMTMAQAGPLAQLATEAATGNNATLFDHISDDAPPAFSPDAAARRLLAAQAFALGFGKAAEAIIGDTPFPRPYLADAICLRGVTLWLSGDNLFQTLLLNLVPSNANRRDDVPLWERDEPSKLLDRVGKDKEKRIKIGAKGVIDRMVWQSRMIRLLPEPDGVVRRAYFTQGREADKTDDPMKAYIDDTKLGRYALNLNAEKAAWRDLHTYLNNGKHRFSALGNIAELVQNGVLPRTALYRLHVVGLATDPGKAGKFLMWRHERMIIPAALLNDEKLLSLFHRGIRDAEYVAQQMNTRIRNVIRAYLPPDGNPDPKDVDKLSSALNPRRSYWARLEPPFATLVNALPEKQDDALSNWRRAVEKEGERAFKATCDQLGESTRAIKAVASATALPGTRFEADEMAATERMNQYIADAKAKKKKAAGTADREIQKGFSYE